MLCTEGRLQKDTKNKANKNEKEQKTFQVQAHGCAQPLSLGDRLVSQVQFYTGSDPKMIATSYGFSLVRRKKLSRDGSLKANELVAPNARSQNANIEIWITLVS